MKTSSNPTGCPPSRLDIHQKPIIGQAADQDLAEMAKAIGHPARLHILRLLLEKQTCICGEIVEDIHLAQSTVSQHLKVLKDVGLIRGEVNGPKTCYCIDSEGLRRFKILAAAL